MGDSERLACTDLSQHVEGLPFERLERFDLPLVSFIEGNLWVGGCIDGQPLPPTFVSVVSMHPKERFVIGPEVRRSTFPMRDGLFMPDEELLVDAVRTVLHGVGEGTTLVHCQAGLNRSALVAGTALVAQGMAERDAVALLRSQRDRTVLCNPTFLQWFVDGGPSRLLRKL